VKLALAADVGGTSIRVALVGRRGRIAQRRSIPTLADEGRDAVLGRLVAALREIASLAQPGSLVGLGLSMPGPTDPGSGTVYNPPNLPGWGVFSPKPLLEEKLSLKASVGHDATLAALAEHVYGAGRGYKHMIYMTVSTGIGGGLVIGGRLYEGRGGFAGELGHMTIDPDGPRCNCGNAGCLEALASGTAVARIAQERLSSRGGGSLLERAGGDARGVDARVVAEAAAAGGPLALEIMREVGANLGIGIANLLNALDPELIVIGGGMSQSLDLLMPGIVQEVERRAMVHHRGWLPVVRSELGDDASLLGAAALAFKKG
jgi:glucokinase